MITGAFFNKRKPMTHLSTKQHFLPIYLMAILQGMAFTTLPAASNFITGSQGLSLSASMYGSLFLPMVIGSIFSSLLAGLFGKRCGLKVLFLAFAVFNVLSMCSFASLAFFSFNIYWMLLSMMTLLGIGFGGMIACLNPFVIYYFPKKASAAITALHACLGIGTALGPLLFSFCLKQDFWFFDPVLLALAFIVFSVIAWAFLDNPRSIEQENLTTPKNIKKSYYYLSGFVAIAFLYGLLETSFGNWGTIYLFQEKKLSITTANYALAIFWFCVTLGRVLTAWMTVKLPITGIYRSLPVLLLGSLLLISLTTTSLSAYLIFALAGLGCSSFLPLTISLASLRYLNQASFVSGLLIAIYMLGYAVASEVFPLMQRMFFVSFAKIYKFDVLPAIILIVFCFLTSLQKSKKKK